MRILGVDPGLRITGYGVIDFSNTPRLVDAGVIRLDSTTEIADRLVELEEELDAIIKELSPQRVAVEMLYANYKHPRTAVLMGHARGVILLVARRHRLAITQMLPNRIKKNLTGNGHASKDQMQRTIQSTFQLAQVPDPPDVADAIAIALAAGRE